MKKTRWIWLIVFLVNIFSLALTIYILSEHFYFKLKNIFVFGSVILSGLVWVIGLILNIKLKYQSSESLILPILFYLLFGLFLMVMWISGLFLGRLQGFA